MDKGMPSSIFMNDGSFMERFKQLQQEQEKGAVIQESRPKSNASGNSVSHPFSSKTNLDSRPNEARKTAVATSGGKLAFSLKQKSKLVAPSVKLGEDDDEDDRETGNASGDGSAKRQKLGRPDASDSASRQDVAPPSPSDPTVKKVADRLASFVAKNGRKIEHVTRQRNPGDTPFKFLFDESCSDYKYYEYCLQEEVKALEQSRDSRTSRNDSGSTSTLSGLSKSQQSSTPATSGPRRPKQSNYQIPTSALYNSNETGTVPTASGGREESGAPQSGADPIAMMEYYMKKAAQEERKRPAKQSQDEMPPPVSLQAPAKRGHHMGDYIPSGELEKFLAVCNDPAAQKAARDAVDNTKIQADNVGHKLLSKMGWKEGEALGSSRKGISDPVMAGEVKKDNLGVGAHKPGEVLPGDDMYEQYKKRMMLGYRYRPNPLNNPRKAYY